MGPRAKARWQRLVVLACLLAAAGCSRAIRFKTPVEEARHPAGLRGGPWKVSVSPVQGASPVYAELVSYLKASPYWRLEPSGGSQTGAYVLKWAVLDESFQTDLPTKRSVVIYLYCTVIDAFLAPFFANMLSWHATQYVEIELALLDPGGQDVYRHKKSLAVNEHDKTLPSTLELKKSIHSLTVRNLVTQAMNRLEAVALCQLGEASASRPE